MNKNTIIIAILILGFVGVVLYLFSQGNTTSNSSSSVTDPSANSAQNAVGDNQKLDSDSRYVVYSKAALDQASGKRRVLYFYANWCPICRPADIDFRENASRIPEDVVIIRVNYNDSDTDSEEKGLARKYNIVYQHTFVQIDDTGVEVTKWNGGKIDLLLKSIK